MSEDRPVGGEFIWKPEEAARLFEAGQADKLWISLKQLAELCDSEGISRDRIKPALSAGVLVATGKPMPNGRGYTDITIRLDTVVRFLALEWARDEGSL
jgi:hypothetical protein